MADTSVLLASKKSAKPRDLKILVIDPDPVSRFRLKTTLRTMDMVEAVSEMSTTKGVAVLLGQRAINVIIIDQFPSEGEVYDIVKSISEQPAAAKTGWVLVADRLDDEIIERGKAAGIDGFLPRPFDILQLEKILTSAAAVRPQGRPKEVQGQLKETLTKLRQVSLFTGFTDQELLRLLKICKTRILEAGNYVFHEGEPGESLYVVVSGRIDINKTTEGTVQTLVSMGPGDCFGEMAIISAEPRFADAVAASDCTLIEVNESVVTSNEDIISLKLVRQIAILLANKLRAR